MDFFCQLLNQTFHDNWNQRCNFLISNKLNPKKTPRYEPIKEKIPGGVKNTLFEWSSFNKIESSSWREINNLALAINLEFALRSRIDQNGPEMQHYRWLELLSCHFVFGKIWHGLRDQKKILYWVYLICLGFFLIFNIVNDSGLLSTIKRFNAFGPFSMW